MRPARVCLARCLQSHAWSPFALPPDRLRHIGARGLFCVLLLPLSTLCFLSFAMRTQRWRALLNDDKGPVAAVFQWRFRMGAPFACVRLRSHRPCSVSLTMVPSRCRQRCGYTTDVRAQQSQRRGPTVDPLCNGRVGPGVPGVRRSALARLASHASSLGRCRVDADYFAADARAAWRQLILPPDRPRTLCRALDRVCVRGATAARVRAW